MDLKETLGSKFICTKCQSHGGHVEELSMSGTGISRLLELQPYRYAFVSCKNCGYTEAYSLSVLKGKDDLGKFLDVLFLVSRDRYNRTRHAWPRAVVTK